MGLQAKGAFSVARPLLKIGVTHMDPCFSSSSSSSIQIFTGSGTSPSLARAWKNEIYNQLDPKKYIVNEFKENYSFSDIKNVSLVIIPGGTSFRMCAGLATVAESVNSALNQYSARFIGSCAGAIAVSDNFYLISISKDQKKFTKLDSYAKLSEISLNSIKTIAPYFTPATLSEQFNSDNITTIEVELNKEYFDIENQTCKIYYAYGPCFMMKYEKSSHFNALDHYNTVGNVSLEEELAATLLYKNTNGNSILLSGIHPEYGYHAINSEIYKNESEKSLIRRLGGLLRDEDETRVKVLRTWFKLLDLQLQ